MLHYSLDWVSFSFQTFINNFALNLPYCINLEILGIKLYLWTNLSNQNVWHICTLVVLFWYISVDVSQTSKYHNLWVISTYVSSCEISLPNIGTIGISHRSPYFHIYTLDQNPMLEVLKVLFFAWYQKNIAVQPRGFDTFIIVLGVDTYMYCYIVSFPSTDEATVQTKK